MLQTSYILCDVRLNNGNENTERVNSAKVAEPLKMLFFGGGEGADRSQPKLIVANCYSPFTLLYLLFNEAYIRWWYIWAPPSEYNWTICAWQLCGVYCSNLFMNCMTHDALFQQRCFNATKTITAQCTVWSRSYNILEGSKRIRRNVQKLFVYQFNTEFHITQLSHSL